MCWDRVIDVETLTDARTTAPLRILKQPADAEPAPPASVVETVAAAS